MRLLRHLLDTGIEPVSADYHSAILPTKLIQLISERSPNPLLGRGPPLVTIQNPKHIRHTEIMNTCDQQDLKTRLCRPIGYPQGEDSTYGVCSSLSLAKECSTVELNHTCCSRLPRWSVSALLGAHVKRREGQVKSKRVRRP